MLEFPVIAAGSSFAELIGQAVGRPGGDAIDPLKDPWTAFAWFAETRVEDAIDEALESARAFAPDLIVCELVDLLAARSPSSASSPGPS